MEKKATVKALWLKEAKRGPMRAESALACIKDTGIVGNADQGGKRQITIIEEENWHKMMYELNSTLPPSTRRANIMIDGLSLYETKGLILHLGEVQILIEGETRPCQRMDQAIPGLRACMEPDWRGGVYGRILNNGVIRIGAPVKLESGKP